MGDAAAPTGSFRNAERGRAEEADRADARPRIDSGALERLREWGGPPLLRQMIRLFLEHAGQRVEQIRTGLETGVIREAEMGAHSLKSSAANLGAERVRHLASAVERAAGADERDAVLELLPELEEAYAEAAAELESIERELPA